MARGYNKVFVLGILFSCCLLLALVACGLAALLWLVFPMVLTSQVNHKVTIEPGHATYEQLQNPTPPLWKSFYFFNLTNPEQFEAGKDIPRLEEKGPYSYRESRTKQFLKFSPDKELVTYNQSKIFHFDPNTTAPGLSESDTICTINIPFIVGANKFENDNAIFRDGYDLFVKIAGAHLYVCHDARSIAWGYTDKLIRDLLALGQYPREYVNIQVNNSINDSYPSTIRTGVDDINLIGEFVQWNGHHGKLDIWPGETANWINGTEGLFFHPNLKEGENLTAFVDDVQRSFDLQYEGKVTHLGLEAYRYGLADHTFYSAFKYPENARWGSWNPEGLFYLGPTQYPEVPIFGSNPHFFNGDPGLLDCVTGLSPNRSENVTKIDVEPITGANIQFQKTLQLNVRVNKSKIVYLENIKGFEGTDALYYPVLWLSEHAELNSDFKQYLEDKGLKEVHMFKIVVPVVFGLLLALGVVLLCISFCTCCCFVRVSRKSVAMELGEREPLLNLNDS